MSWPASGSPGAGFLFKNEMKKISLCMICGNEEAVILRCLDSAKDAFDELCLVRAIGEQTPDRTEAAVFKWCFENGKELIGAEYLNQISGLQHVDNFGAARNLSFSLATGDYLLWLDCDDILTPETCAMIRTLAEENGADCYTGPYYNGGAVCPRERLIRRGAGVWKNRIHETCQIASNDLCHETNLVVFHNKPVSELKKSSTRNRKLLEITLEDFPRHLFYLHEEYFGDRNAVEIIRTGHAVLPLLKEKPEELYEVMLNLAEFEQEKAEEWLLKALALQPWRREALAMLAQNALQTGKFNHAVSYFRYMDALPAPDPLPWTHRRIWHGWGRNYLRVKILRARGQLDQAKEEHTKFLEDPTYASQVAKFEAGAPDVIQEKPAP